jgi:hypothetical protein
MYLRSFPQSSFPSSTHQYIYHLTLHFTGFFEPQDEWVRSSLFELRPTSTPRLFLHHPPVHSSVLIHVWIPPLAGVLAASSSKGGLWTGHSNPGTHAATWLLTNPYMYAVRPSIRIGASEIPIQSIASLGQCSDKHN